MEPPCAAARLSCAVQAVTFCAFRRLRPLCRLHRLDEAVLWLLSYLFFVLAALHGAARAKQVVERYHAPYESKAAYFATLDAILRDRELIEYHEDTAQIRL